MFAWGILFLIIAIVAAFLGFGGVGRHRGMGGAGCFCRRLDFVCFDFDFWKKKNKLISAICRF